MIKLETDRSKIQLRSIKSLSKYLDYLADPGHKDHEGMTLLAGRNYGCADDSPKSFVDGVKKSRADYIAGRNGLDGKRIRDQWRELIFNAGKGVYHTQEERDLIEKKIIAEFAPTAVARAVWHIAPDGHDDLHILIAATCKSKDGGKQEVTMRRTKVHLHKRFRKIDREIANYLNDRPNPKRIRKIKSAAQVGREKSLARTVKNAKPKPLSFEQQIASKSPKKEVTAEELPKILAKLGVKILLATDKSITVQFPRFRRKGAHRVRREGKYPLRELFLMIMEAQMNIALAKQKVQEVAGPFKS